MNNKLFKLYTLAIMNYENKFKNIVNSTEELYPKSWNRNTDYKNKIEIIKEAIKENKLIINTNIYQKYINNIKE